MRRLKLFLNSTLAMLCLLSLSCSPSNQDNQAVVDGAKLEQIKRILTEEEKKSNTPSATPSPSPGDAGGSQLLRIVVRPGSLRLIEGMSLEFRVLAIRKDSRETSLDQGVSLSLDNTQVASLFDAPDSARFEVKGLVPGVTLLHVSYKDLKVDVQVEVVAKELLSLEILPKTALLGSPTRFSLVGMYDNGTQTPVNGTVQWESTDTLALSFAGSTLDPSVFMGRKTGIFGVRASYAGSTVISRTRIQMPTLKSLTIENDGQSLKVGSFTPLKALATFQNDEVFDISSSVQWTSSDAALAIIDSQGVLEAKGAGDVLVRAVYERFQADTEFNLNDMTYVSYQLEPSVLTVPIGLTASFDVYGTQANGTRTRLTEALQIRVDDSTLVQLGGLTPPEQKGIVGGLAKGQSTLRLRYGQRAWSLPVNVVDAVPRELTITSTQPDGTCGVHKPRFTAEATLSDGSKRDVTAEVTWSVEPSTMGVASNANDTTRGLISTTAPGSADVVASLPSFGTSVLRTSSPIKIGPAVVLGLTIRAPEASLAIGESMQLGVMTQLSCGTGTDLTNQAQFSSSDTSVLEISNLVGTRGFLTTRGNLTNSRQVTIRADKTDWSGTLAVEVRPKEIKFITIRPVSTQIVIGGNTTSHIVEAKYSDASIADITSLTGMSAYSLRYYLTDCTGGPCASIDTNTGVLTSASTEGLVRPYVSLTTPQNTTLTSAKASIKIVSECDGGTRSAYYCVSLGSAGANCNDVCAARGATYHSATNSFFGKTGDPNECSLALKALGYVKGLETTSFNYATPVGCAIWNIATLGIQQSVRETSNAATAEAANAAFQRVCACRE